MNRTAFEMVVNSVDVVAHGDMPISAARDGRRQLEFLERLYLAVANMMTTEEQHAHAPCGPRPSKHRWSRQRSDQRPVEHCRTIAQLNGHKPMPVAEISMAMVPRPTSSCGRSSVIGCRGLDFTW